MTTTAGRQFIPSLPGRSSNLEIDSTSETVSLIIVNYNAGNCLRACVSSALSQVDEVVVVETHRGATVCRNLKPRFHLNRSCWLFVIEKILGLPRVAISELIVQRAVAYCFLIPIACWHRIP